MATDAPILVVGGDGLIGRALVRHLRRLGRGVIATSRRAGTGDLALDLGDPASWPELPEVSAAVIVAAIARLGDCDRDPVGSAKVNVEAPARLVAMLAPRGTYCLQLSTDKVFDGTVALRSRGDAPCPATEYGRQKAAAEAAVLAAGGAVLRLSKVLAPDLDLLRDWRRKLLAGEPITPFHDMWLAPVGVDLVTDLIARLVADRAPGISHCTGAEDRPYVAMAQALVAALKVTPDLVRPISAEGILAAAQRVRHSTLEMRREAALYGIGNPGFGSVLAALLA